MRAQFIKFPLGIAGNLETDDEKPTLRLARGKELPPERSPVPQRPEDLLGHRGVSLHDDAAASAHRRGRRGRPRGRGGGRRGGTGPTAASTEAVVVPSIARPRLLESHVRLGEDARLGVAHVSPQVPVCK